jgi:hypothetical protein
MPAAIPPSEADTKVSCGNISEAEYQKLNLSVVIYKPIFMEQIFSRFLHVYSV